MRRVPALGNVMRNFVNLKCVAEQILSDSARTIVIVKGSMIVTMEPHTIINTSAALFGVAALGGVLMAGMRFSGMPHPPAWLAMVHGLLAAAGLTLLMYAAVAVGIPAMAQLALVLFIIAAIGGAALNLLFHWKLLPLPIPLMILHALLAVAGFVLLLVSIFR